MMKQFTNSIFGLFVFFIVAYSSNIRATPVKIYAATSLIQPLDEIVNIYHKQFTHTQILPVYAASSTLAKQIEFGAQSDIYFSADRDWINYLVNKNKIKPTTINSLLKNSLVLVTLNSKKQNFIANEKFNFDQSFKGYLCTGQMESVPVGRYARQSLIYFKWHKPLKRRIVATDNARATIAFVERGECSLGIVYKTDALLSRKLKIVGIFPELSHRPIIYPIAMTNQGATKQDALHFYNFLKTDPRALNIYRKFGFKLWN